MISPSLKRVAYRSTHSQFFHAAQIKIGGAVLATANNTSSYAPNAYGHAETRVCRTARASGHTLRGATVISIRVTKTGKLANAKPCTQCVTNMREYGIRKVIYSVADGSLVMEKL